ncbi:MAG: hypothetical protein ACOCRX_06155 [Candidatus Woesearchaeota archaeon]
MNYRKYLKDCSDEKAFLFSDGTKVHSLNELYSYLERSGKGIFDKHVDDNRNDFYGWIKEVIGDVSFAERIEFTKRYDLFLKKLKHRIDFIESKVSETESLDEDLDSVEVSEKNHSKTYNANNSPEEYGLAVEYIQSGLKDFLLGLIIGIVLGVVILQMI